MNKWVCPDCGDELKADGFSAWLSCSSCRAMWQLDGLGKLDLGSRRSYARDDGKREG